MVLIGGVYLAQRRGGAEEVVNFGMATLKEGFLRFVNNYSDPALCASASLREDISFNKTGNECANDICR